MPLIDSDSSFQFFVGLPDSITDAFQSFSLHARTNTVNYSGSYPRPLPSDYHPEVMSLPQTTVDDEEGNSKFI